MDICLQYAADSVLSYCSYFRSLSSLFSQNLIYLFKVPLEDGGGREGRGLVLESAEYVARKRVGGKK